VDKRYSWADFSTANAIFFCLSFSLMLYSVTCYRAKKLLPIIASLLVLTSYVTWMKSV
jgi:hypothetical protein